MTTAPSSFWQLMWHTRLRDMLRGRIDGRLDWQQVIAGATLPEALSAVVTQVVRRTRLWRIEKVDVAQELVAHFQDGLDAGRTPEQLINSFGDPQQAARLIRRAKKRGRQMAWHVWRWSFWSIAGLIVLYDAPVIYLVMGQPSIKTDYLAMINERALAVPEDERAWPLYREAMAKMNLIKLPSCLDDADLGPDDEAWPEAVAWLNEHADALALVREASSRPGLGFPVWWANESFAPEDRQVLPDLAKNLADDHPEEKLAKLEDRWLLATLLPHVPATRDLSRILSIDARRAALSGDGNTTLDDANSLFGLSRHIHEVPFLANSLVALRCEEIAYATVQEAMTEHAVLWSDDQLRELAHRIAAAEIDWHRAYEGERACIYDVVQRMYTDNGHGDGRITDEGLLNIETLLSLIGVEQSTSGGWRAQFKKLAVDVAWVSAAPASVYVVASRGELLSTYERLMDQQEAALGQPLWEVEPNSVEKERKEWSAIEKMRFFPIDILMPSLSELRCSIETVRGMRDGVLVGIALELYHREHDAWPKTLDELSLKYLPSVPGDRFNGNPLHYRIVDGRPLVYSIGVDGDDDSGRVPLNDEKEPDGKLASPKALGKDPNVTPPDGDWVIWSTAAK